MALITCKECGKEISSSAESCPHCGHKTETATKNAQLKDRTIAFCIAAAAVCIGLFLLIPAMATLIENYNDWYFWNWYTERSDEVIRNIGLGIGLIGGGLGVSLWLRKSAKAMKNNEESDENQ